MGGICQECTGSLRQSSGVMRGSKHGVTYQVQDLDAEAERERFEDAEVHADGTESSFHSHTSWRRRGCMLRSSTKPYWRRHTLHCLVLCSILFGVAAAYCLDGTGTNDIMTAVYVIVQIVTTVGYGDVPVESQAIKVGMTFYVLFLIIVAGYVFNVFKEWVFSLEIERIKDAISREDQRGNRSHLLMQRAGLFFFLSIALGTLFYRLWEQCSCSYGYTWKTYTEARSLDGTLCPEYHTTPRLGWPDIDFKTCEEAGGFVKTWIDAFYMSVITVTTVGFGDVAPKSYVGRIFGIVWIIGGVVSTGVFVNMLSVLFFQEKHKRPWIITSDLRSSKLRDQVLHNFRTQREGYLTRDEYVAVVLLVNGLVPSSFIFDLYTSFDDLDVARSGSISFDEVFRSLDEEEDEEEEYSEFE